MLQAVIVISANTRVGVDAIFLQRDSELTEVVLRLPIDEASLLVCLNDSRRSIWSYPHLADALEQGLGGPVLHNLDLCESCAGIQHVLPRLFGNPAILLEALQEVCLTNLLRQILSCLPPDRSGPEVLPSGGE